MFIPITRGDSYLATFTLYNRDKSIHKMSVGEHLTFTMKTSKNVEEATISRYYGNGILFNQSTNKYEIELDAISTAELTNIDYPFDIEYVSSMNDVKTLIQGVFKVCLDVTEPNNREGTAELLRISPNLAQNFSAGVTEELWADASEQNPQNEVFLGDFNISMSYREKVSETITITPTKNIQTAKPTDTDHEIVEVIVNPIPDQYNDTVDASASAADVLAGKTFYGPQGKTEGAMQQYDGTTNIVPDDKEIQQFETQGKYVAEPLIVEAIPVYEKELDEQDTKLSELEDEIKTLPDALNLSDATATANDIAKGKTAYTRDGKVEGTLQDRLQWICDNMEKLNSEFSGYQGESLDEILDGLDLSNVKSLNSTFYNCPNLVSLDLSEKITAENTDGTDACRQSRSLAEVKLWDLINTTTLKQVFLGCSNLQEAYLTNSQNVQNWEGAFSGASNLKEIYGIDTTYAINTASMFYKCNNITNETIKRANFSLKNATTTSSMFYYVENVTELDVGELPNVKNASYMFRDCRKVVTINVTLGAEITEPSGLFYGCVNLENIIGSVNLLNATTTTAMFVNCSKLKNVTLLNIKKSLKATSSSLVDETIINTAKELWDLTGGTSQTLTLSTASKNRFDAIYVKLITATEEQIAEDPYINNKKPCVVCESTDEGAMTLREYVVSKGWALA